MIGEKKEQRKKEIDKEQRVANCDDKEYNIIKTAKGWTPVNDGVKERVEED